MRQWKIVDKKLVLSHTDIPTQKPNHKVIKVTAIGVNRADTLQVQGLYPSPDNSSIPGLEVSGMLNGKEVCALITSGGYAEYVSVPENQVLPIPKTYNVIEAAALPEALITCYLNIFKIAKLQSSNSILIHGATSGIGSFAIKLCKAFGAKVYGSVGNDDKITKCSSLGADYIFNYNNDWVDDLKRRGGADIILDILGGSNLEKNVSALNKNGKLISIAVMTWAISNINLASVLMKNLTIIGSTLRSQSPEQKSDLIKNAITELYSLIETNNIKPIVDSVYNFEDAPKAIAHLESRKHFGKVVIKI
jgi:NADPH2:quinone reductase